MVRSHVPSVVYPGAQEIAEGATQTSQQAGPSRTAEDAVVHW